MLLAKGSTILCSDCNFPYNLKTDFCVGYSCLRCSALMIKNNNEFIRSEKAVPVLEDMSPLKLGSQGVLEGNKFEIIGRIKFNLKGEYKNHWCLLFSNNSWFWLGESYGDYYFIKKEKTPIDPSRFKVRKIGRMIKFPNGIQYEIQYFNEVISYACEGEIPEFPFLKGNFISLELSDKGDRLVFVNVYSANQIDYYLGKYLLFDQLNFTNLRDLNGWK